MYNNLKISISKANKESLKDNLYAKIIFTNKGLDKDSREVLSKVNAEYIATYYAIYNKINSEVDAQNNIAWIKRAFYFLKDEIKYWKK